MSDIAEAHRTAAAAFTDRVRGVAPDAWDNPAPCAGWVARDVVRHLVEWLPGFLAAGSTATLPAVPDVDADPLAAWTAHRDAVQALLEDPARAAAVLHNPHLGELPVARAVDMFYTTDVFLHTWDLARATGQDERLDPDRCAALLAGMTGMEQAMRASGQFGPAVPVPADADAQTRLLGFIGRQP
ncbi:hypothetical protein GCM10010124_23420 [Pilimelia terevasa]|uniref:Mycothiol-dependent maleylpyruvate isomerase metal-binding domain-containing protein n=1 Tax=Pilimelia terevasa TaxID=53372 RepID=A0A8J3BRI1_9ACTN|nr:TIGR03086 family metal-binding protein [Pilimelia terevasa]GGK29977.1 hypothetical protein GCM10010124_23420 [Pilimelia terevasa]